MSFDWQGVVRALAPTLGAALGGPMAGAAAKTVADAVLGREAKSDDEIGQALGQGLTPEAVVALRTADQNFKLKLEEVGLSVQNINAQLEQAYIADTKDARQVHHGDVAVFRLGIAVLAIFALTMAAVLGGIFHMLGGGMKLADAGIIAAVFGLLGSVVGYVAANAQQVVAYFFGSSKGSKDKTDALAAAITQASKRP